MTNRLRMWIGIAIAAIAAVALALTVVTVVGIPGRDSDTDTTAAAISVVDTVAPSVPDPPATTTRPPRPCDRRIINISGLTVRAEPKVASRADDQLELNRPVCVMLTSKDGRWIYVRYTDPGVDPADSCMGESSSCPSGWVAKRFTVVSPDEDASSTTAA